MKIKDRMFNRVIDDPDLDRQVEKLVEKLVDFSKMTHSFSELDPTLEGIVEDAIRDDFGEGVACTQEQWIAIKHLLDSSLYIKYNNFSMIKTVYKTDSYVFGSVGNIQTDSSFELVFNSIDNKLFAKYTYL